MNSDTEFGIEGVTFAENTEPGPFRKLFMISDGRRMSNGIVIIYIVIFLLFMPSIGGFVCGLTSLLAFIPVIFLSYYAATYLQDWAMDEKFGTSFQNFWVNEEE